MRGDLEGLGEQLGRDDAADHRQDDQRVAVERQARRPVTSRRKKAQAIETRTMTATTFCIALMSVHSRPSNGIDRSAG